MKRIPSRVGEFVDQSLILPLYLDELLLGRGRIRESSAWTHPAVQGAAYQIQIQLLDLVDVEDSDQVDKHVFQVEVQDVDRRLNVGDVLSRRMLLLVFAVVTQVVAADEQRDHLPILVVIDDFGRLEALDENRCLIDQVVSLLARDGSVEPFALFRRECK